MAIRQLQRLQSAAQPSEDARLAAFMRVHGRPADAQRPQGRFSAKLALQRAFVAAPTD